MLYNLYTAAMQPTELHIRNIIEVRQAELENKFTGWFRKTLDISVYLRLHLCRLVFADALRETGYHYYHHQHKHTKYYKDEVVVEGKAEVIS